MTLKSWYSIKPTLDIEEHEPVNVTQAIEIADTYLQRVGEKCENGEESIATTAFGFGSNEQFIELCIFNTTLISYKFETSEESKSWLGRLRKGVFQREEQLRNRDEMIRRIQDFFMFTPDEIRDRCKRQD